MTLRSDEHSSRVLSSFNRIAASYDSLRFVQLTAARLIERAALPNGARVLDLGTGTGMVALVAADLVGPAGHVVGVDISPSMLAHARQKQAALSIANIEFRQGDAQQLDLPDQSFDVVLCASALFFIPDMQAVLDECRRVLVPGGRLGFTSFGAGFLQPLNQMVTDRLKVYGITPGERPNLRLPDPAACRQLLETAGFDQIEVEQAQLDYIHPSSAERWTEIEGSLDGLALQRLSAEQREQFRAEHLVDLDALPEIKVYLPVLLAFGRKPNSDR